MKKTRFLMLLISIVLAIPAMVSAQAARNTKEAVNNERQIKVDKKQVTRDQREVREFQSLLTKMDSARAQRAMDTYHRTNGQLRALMYQELEDARRKAAQSNVEVGQSHRERRGERLEAGTAGSAQDYHQPRDDNRDLRDDGRDRHQATARHDEMRRLLERAEVIAPGVKSGNRNAMDQCRDLMGSFLIVMHADLAASQAELREDGRERNEDRRERRSDYRR